MAVNAGFSRGECYEMALLCRSGADAEAGAKSDYVCGEWWRTRENRGARAFVAILIVEKIISLTLQPSILKNPSILSACVHIVTVYPFSLLLSVVAALVTYVLLLLAAPADHAKFCA